VNTISRTASALLLAASVLGMATACGGGSNRPEVTVAAAADLQFAFQEIGTLFEEQCGCKVTLIFGSSGNLAAQIENGLPVDMFASADIAYVDRLKEKGLILEDTQQLYAVGRIVLAVNKDSGIQVENLSDLLKAEVRKIAIANPEHAPYGVAAMQALQSEGLWEDLKPRLVYGENVRQALQYIQTGDAQAGIVALSVAAVPEVSYTLIDDSLHQPLRQSLAVLRRTGEEQLARDFIAFVNGPQGRPIMKKYGFMLPGES
jgi:molybdate transport system substrate-binding protein